MAYIEKRVLSSDGQHTLVGRVYRPEGEVRGLFQVVHGMTEHIGRYERFMEKMAEEGYLTFGYDHIGHGKTGDEGGEFGYFAPKDGWRLLCRDVSVFAEAVRCEYGEGLPYFLMGHSMGSFIARMAARYYCRPTALVVMGTGGPNPAAGIGIALGKLIGGIYGDRHISKLLLGMAFGSYNKRFREEDGKAWLTTDKEIRKIYKNDPYCSFYFTVSGMCDLMQLLKRSNAADWFCGIDKGMPILLVAGEDDPVGGYGKGVKTVFGKLQAAGADVEISLYKGCRHEILNDSCKDEVIEDILNFIADR